MAYRRSIFLINKPFQVRFSFYVCSWLVALSFIYPLIVYNLFDYFIRFAALDPMGPSLAGLQKTRQEILVLLVAVELIFLVFTFLMSLFMSHRIAGPLYKLRMYFEKARNGDYKSDLFFRKKDHFQELADDYNNMIKEMRGALSANSDGISSAADAIQQAIGQANGDSRSQLERALATLRTLEQANRSKIG